MKCPNDDTMLVIADRQGIEIDYCPQCRGVWLDRGELDKLIERSNAQPYGRENEHHGRSDYQNHDSGHYDRDSHSQRPHDPRKKHKREGFLGDLFEFGD